MADSWAIVTPSYGPDLPLCEVLVESVREFATGDVQHLIIVDDDEIPMFRHLEGGPTHIVPKSRVVPATFRKVPWSNRWVSLKSPRPASGWLMQQIVKIGSADLTDAPTLVFADSDLAFVREVGPELFRGSAGVRRFKKREGITKDMAAHVSWYSAACEMLGVAVGPLPADDYINWLVSWDRETVMSMREHISRTSRRPWFLAMARHHHVSEYLLYGVYSEHFARETPFLDSPTSHCHGYWEYEPMLEHDLDEFVSSFSADDVAVGIQSASHTSAQVRLRALDALSGGRLRCEGLRRS